jgi:hypothetical protein
MATAGGKCIWCAARDVELEEVRLGPEVAAVCSDACRSRAEGFVADVEAHKVHFLAGLIGLPLLGVVLLFLLRPYDQGASGTFVVFAGMGLVLLRYPFVTPQTVQLLGLARSVRLARWLGAACVLGGAIAAVLVYVYGCAGG